MLRKQLFLVFLCVPTFLFSQNIERIEIMGKVTAPIGEDIEGVAIYNISNQTGTVTTPEGYFELMVAENDRISVTALQFSAFVIIVDQEVVDTKKMDIYLNPVVNQLEEVLVRPYDLTGNITADVSRIKTANVVTQWDLSYEALEFEFEFTPDKYTSIAVNKAEEAYFNGQQQAGLNFIGLAGLLFPKKNKKTKNGGNEDRSDLAKSLRHRFSNDYLLSSFGIYPRQAYDFIDYLQENGMHSSLLRQENEMRLLDLMLQRSKTYKKLSE